MHFFFPCMQFSRDISIYWTLNLVTFKNWVICKPPKIKYIQAWTFFFFCVNLSLSHFGIFKFENDHVRWLQIPSFFPNAIALNSFYLFLISFTHIGKWNTYFGIQQLRHLENCHLKYLNILVSQRFPVHPGLQE